MPWLVETWVRGLTAAEPVGPDPLGSVPQDPDVIRDAACKLVAEDRVCVPPTTAPPRAPTGSNAVGGIVELLAWIVFVGLVVVLLVLAVRAIARRSPRGARRRRGSTAVDDDDEVIRLGRSALIDDERDPASWRRESDEHRLAGRHREAIRCRYRAVVGDLARRDLIDEVPGRTTGEERSQWAERFPAQRASFDALADLFDDAWYGDVLVDASDVDRALALERAVLTGAEAEQRRQRDERPVGAPR